MDGIFDLLYEKAGGLTKDVNGDLSNILKLNRTYLDAKYKALADEITAKFNAKKFEPEICTLSIPITLSATVSEYKFTDYQVLDNTLLLDFCLPIYNSMTLYVNGAAILPAADLAKGWLTLVNDRQQNVVFRDTLTNYFRDTAFWEGKGKFDNARMDWNNCKIEFPSLTVPAANVGAVIVPVVRYIDMKRYPFMK